MVFHHAIDFRKKFRASHLIRGDRTVERMNLHFRVAHWLTVVSFPVLVFTGFALKYPESWWARPLLQWEGRFPLRAVLHRTAAVILLASVGYHATHLLAVKKDRAHWRDMIPNLDDLANLGDTLRYNLGFSATRPLFGRFSYVEKIEYLAFLWGTVVMAITGFILWFNGPALRYLPKWVSDAATALHFYEAILATCAIAIWHMYTAMFDPDVYPMDRAWIDGKVSAEHLRQTRPIYYAEATGSEFTLADEPPETQTVDEYEADPIADEFSER
jgi:formate dehydrogenase gamma subunit